MIDGEALERIKHPGNRIWLREWSELIRALESEGSLTVVDVSTAARSRSQERGHMLRRDIINPQRWWQAMGFYNDIIGRTQGLLGDSPEEAKNFSWDFDPEASFGLPGKDGKVHDLAVVLHEAGKSKSQEHRDLFETAFTVLKDQLREVNSCIIACDELDVAPLMWASYRRYLEEKLQLPSDQNPIELQAGGRQFFKVVFPAYSPTTVRTFSKLRTDKRIKALRGEIHRATQKGELLDPKYPQRVLTEIFNFERKAGRLRRIIGWIATAIGTIPVPGLGLATAGISEAITSRLEGKQRKQWHWFYLISDGRGST